VLTTELLVQEYCALRSYIMITHLNQAQSEYKHSLTFRVRRYVVRATKPIHRLQIRPILHNWRASPYHFPKLHPACPPHLMFEYRERNTGRQFLHLNRRPLWNQCRKRQASSLTEGLMLNPLNSPDLRTLTGYSACRTFWRGLWGGTGTLDC